MTHFAIPSYGVSSDRNRMAAAKRAQGVERRRAVLDALRTAGGTMGTADLAAIVGITPNALRVSHLPRLVRAGAVACGHGVVRLVGDAADGGGT